MLKNLDTLKNYEGYKIENVFGDIKNLLTKNVIIKFFEDNL